MGKRKFQVGDMMVVNDKVPKHMGRYIGHKGKIANFYEEPPILYELRDCLDPFYARELDRTED